MKRVLLCTVLLAILCCHAYAQSEGDDDPRSNAHLGMTIGAPLNPTARFLNLGGVSLMALVTTSPDVTPLLANSCGITSIQVTQHLIPSEWLCKILASMAAETCSHSPETIVSNCGAKHWAPTLLVVEGCTTGRLSFAKELHQAQAPFARQYGCGGASRAQQGQ